MCFCINFFFFFSIPSCLASDGSEIRADHTSSNEFPDEKIGTRRYSGVYKRALMHTPSGIVKKCAPAAPPALVRGFRCNCGIIVRIGMCMWYFWVAFDRKSLIFYIYLQEKVRTFVLWSSFWKSVLETIIYTVYFHESIDFQLISICLYLLSKAFVTTLSSQQLNIALVQIY